MKFIMAISSDEIEEALPVGGELAENIRPSSVLAAASFHASLSFTFARMKSVSSAGRPPMKNIGRQPQCGKTVQNATRRQQIAERVAFLQKPERMPRHFAGTDSSASDAPTPHSPPMPMP